MAPGSGEASKAGEAFAARVNFFGWFGMFGLEWNFDMSHQIGKKLHILLA